MMENNGQNHKISPENLYFLAFKIDLEFFKASDTKQMTWFKEKFQNFLKVGKARWINQ